MTDLYLIGQQNTAKLKLANLLDTEKTECVCAQQEHLGCAKGERHPHNDLCDEAKVTFEAVQHRICLSEAHELFFGWEYEISFRFYPADTLSQQPIATWTNIL